MHLQLTDLLFFVLTALLCGVWLRKYWPKHSKSPLGLGLALFIWHFAFTALYYVYTFHNPSDAWAYYHDPSFRGNAENWQQLYGVGITFIHWLVYPFSQWIGLSYFMVFCLFSYTGLFAIYYFLFILEEKFNYKVDKDFLGIAGLLFLFWPSLHFWSAATGKDGIALLSIIWIFYAWLDLKKRWEYALIALLFLFHIRPHLVALIAGAYFTAWLIIVIRSKNFSKINLLIIGLVISAFLIAIPFLLPKVDVFDASINGLSKSLEKMQSRFSDTNHGLDLREMSIFGRYFTFMFRPIWGDSTHLLGYGLMAQNYLLMAILAISLLKIRLNSISFPSFWFLGAGIYLMVGTFIFSQALSNLGLIDREKIMFTPILFIFILWVWTKNN
jgi:hypothetical protein